MLGIEEARHQVGGNDRDDDSDEGFHRRIVVLMGRNEKRVNLCGKEKACFVQRLFTV